MNLELKKRIALAAQKYIDQEINLDEFFRHGGTAYREDADIIKLYDILEHFPGKDDEHFQEYYDGAKEIIDRILGED